MVFGCQLGGKAKSDRKGGLALLILKLSHLGRDPWCSVEQRSGNKNESNDWHLSAIRTSDYFNGVFNWMPFLINFNKLNSVVIYGCSFELTIA